MVKQQVEWCGMKVSSVPMYDGINVGLVTPSNELSSECMGAEPIMEDVSLLCYIQNKFRNLKRWITRKWL